MNLHSAAMSAIECAACDGADFDDSVAMDAGPEAGGKAWAEESLVEHDRRFHPQGYKSGQSCKFRDKMATLLKKSGQSLNVKGLERKSAPTNGGGAEEPPGLKEAAAEKKFLELKAKYEHPGQQEISKAEYVKARADYFKEALGAVEANAIQAMMDAAQRDGEVGEKVEEKAQEILHNLASSTAQKEGAKAILNAREEWKVGNKTYVDLDAIEKKYGFWESVKAAAKAGFEGNEILTTYDKMTGAWDRIRMSDPEFEKANGLVKDAVAEFMFDDAAKAGFDEALKLEGLTDEDIVNIGGWQAQYETAKTPTAKIKAYNEMKQYLREHGLEKETAAKSSNEGLPDIRANFKGEPPNTDIYEPTPADETDDSYAKDLGTNIGKELARRKLAAKVKTYKDGSSIVQFRIVRDPDNDPDKTGLKTLSDKQLEAHIKDIAKDLGMSGKFSYETATDGSAYTAFIRVNKPKTRDAGLRRLLENSKADPKVWKEVQKMRSPFLAGETAEGKPIWIDLKENGFIGGDPGSGKSERLRSGLAGAFHTKSPNEYQVLVNAHVNSADFKHMTGDPHMAGEIADSIEKVAENFAKANAEWHRREELFKNVGAKDIDEYNAKMREAGKPGEQLPQLQVVTDEVTNLLQDRPDLAAEIKRLTTNGRKFGVTHLGSSQDLGATNMPKEILGAERMGVWSKNPTSSDKIFGYRVQELRNIERKGGMLVTTPNGLVRVRGTYAGSKNLDNLREYNQKAYAKGDGGEEGVGGSPE